MSGVDETKSDPEAPFQRTDVVDKPGIVGAKWWHEALADESQKVARRSALASIVVAGGALAGFGALVAMCARSSSSSSSGTGALDPSEATEQRKTSLDVQKDFGWSFGAYDEPLVFDGLSQRAWDPAAATGLLAAMRPARVDLRPYYQPTLFDAVTATPRASSQLDPELFAKFKRLDTAVTPIRTPAMELAYAKGQALASLFDGLREAGGAARDAKAGVLVDLSGPEAVAFAAGAASVFDPVFLFDNWPHPRGVVQAHETLGAALFYQPLFDKARSVSGAQAKPPMFVLDRRRLTTYTDDASQFDNRFVAKLPSPAAALSGLGVERLLYVVPLESDAGQEVDDLNDDFLLFASGGVEVRALSLELFVKATDEDRFYYGGSATSHPSFFLDYPWAKPPKAAGSRPARNRGKDYKPTPRPTPYSTGASSGSVAKQRPSSFGTVPIIVAVGTGVVLGARYTRSGSWNRSSGGGWTS